MVKSRDQQVHQAKRKKREKMETNWKIIMQSRKKWSVKIKRTKVEQTSLNPVL